MLSYGLRGFPKRLLCAGLSKSKRVSCKVSYSHLVSFDILRYCSQYKHLAARHAFCNAATIAAHLLKGS